MSNLIYKYCLFCAGDIAYIVQNVTVNGYWNFARGAEFFKFKNVPKKPMIDINTCEDF